MSRLFFNYTHKFRVKYDPNLYSFVDKDTLTKWFPWKQVVQHLDYQLGRNQTVFFLKFFGILTVNNRPIIENINFEYFQMGPIRNTNPANGFSYKKNEIYIQGQGIFEIKKLILTARLSGSNI